MIDIESIDSQEVICNLLLIGTEFSTSGLASAHIHQRVAKMSNMIYNSRLEW